MLIRRVVGKFSAVKWVSEDGHIFRMKRKLKTNKKSVYMSCHNRECHGSCLVLFQVEYDKNPEIGEVFEKFPHSPGIVCRDQHYEEVQGLRKRILERAANENTPNSVIFQEEISRAPIEVRNRINFKEVERSMQRSHQSLNPRTPTSLGEFAELIQQWSNRYGSINNEKFFIGKFGTGDDECLIAIVTPIITSGLDKKADLHMDGTFKCRPKEPRIAQLYVLMASEHGRAFPIVWALMKSKAASAYNVLFETVKAHIPGINPTIIMSDFESGLRPSVKKHFPEAKHVGCWFHFSQAIERKAKKLGIRPGDHDGWKVAKRLMATALVPPSRAEEAVAVIVEFADNASSHVGASKKLIAYFKKQWIKNVTPASFSVYGQPRRTNNCQEALNRCINRTIKPQGNTWDFWDPVNDEPVEQEEIAQEEQERAGDPYEFYQLQVDAALANYRFEKKSLNPATPFDMCTVGFVNKQLNHLLADLADAEERSAANGNACFLCTENEASRVSVPCGNWVGCHGCILNWVSTQKYLQMTNADGTITTDFQYLLPVRCPVCFCLIGKLQRVFG